jgi:hypothetical protein
MGSGRLGLGVRIGRFEGSSRPLILLVVEDVFIGYNGV